ncbi:biofilm regulation protein kinase SiaB [Ectothiorhodospira lacustris]|uniref:biofilm regulation protein kinase SiaB n=1 Tax=Ectothiorhodospira lacustris TaxID=2899127 RepID=UPI001EE857D4|nr:biofilm regulation protein kinase SiaB [Ectothiorhodospira lacustris]MCG5500577.1 biofilm regulation protein kinase SiaB [Ectothiorhodospira lacustris]MCG5508770.1 biofilm regulation protein kinase SiaB [Ectothiorhodospira lacustris]MCG5520561.1 biofilm regulation protein kinase SiaB [Ectothiorhodospira lacustris]
MSDIDLFSLRRQFNEDQILLCFNGPISRSLIEEIGNALRNYLEADNALPGAAMDVFGIYIELTQNIRHYVTRMGYDERDGSATVIVARNETGRYVIMAGNLVEREDGELLRNRVEELAAMDKVELKAAYKAQLRKPRDESVLSGAGLGLVDVARKSLEPVCARISPVNDGNDRVFFSLRAVI